MSNEDIKFQIAELRKDKILYAVEIGSVVLVCLFGLRFSELYFPSGLRTTIDWLLLVIVVAYGIFVLIGNILRWRKIKRLEKELFD